MLRETFNSRFALLLGVFALFAAFGWTAVHAYQVARNTDLLLEQATRAEADGNTKRAQRLLSLYLDRRPNDTGVRIRLGQLLDGRADRPDLQAQVLQAFDTVLEKEPDHDDLRRRCAQLALQLRFLERAEKHLNVLREKFPENAQYANELGLCFEAREKFVDAARLYQQAVTLQPNDNLSTWERLARLQHGRLNDDAGAEKTLEEMLAVSQPQARARYLAALLRYDWGQLAEADGEIQAALKQAPDDADVLLLAADLALRLQKGGPVARTYLRHAADIQSQNSRPWEGLAAVELLANDLPAALKWIDEGLTHAPESANLLWNKAHLLVASGRIEDAKAVAEKIAPGKLPPGRQEFLRGAILVRDGYWREAVAVLEASRPEMSGEPKVVMQAEMLLGRCHRAVGDHDRAILAFRRAADIDPTYLPARLGVIGALLSLGKPDSALRDCEELMRLPHVPISTALLLARLRLLETLRQPLGERNWSKVDSALQDAEKVGAPAQELTLLRAEALFGRGKTEDAQALLEAARDKNPAEPDNWFALIELADRVKDSRHGDALMEQAERRLGDTVECRLARARHMLNTLGDSAAPKIAGLGENVGRFSAPDQSSLLNGLAALEQVSKQNRLALDLYQRVAKLEPHSLGVRLAVFDLALSIGDDELLQHTLEEQREIEGADGPLTRYNQSRLLIRQGALIAAGSKANSEDLPAVRAKAEQARQLLSQVAAQRPAWSRVPLSIAQSYEVEGAVDRAIEAYLHAVELGDRQLEVIRRVVELLSDRRRFPEADLVIRKLPEQTPLFANLQRLAADVSLETDDRKRALDYALRAVPTDSKDPKDQRWLGNILYANGSERYDDAARAFRKAIDLKPTDPASWVALVQFYTRINKPTEARSAIAEMEKAIGRSDAPLALAQVYAAAGQSEEAWKRFQALMQSEPNNVIVLEHASDYALRSGRRDDAKAIFRRIIALHSKDAAAADKARRLLAVVLAAGGTYQESREALSLVQLANNSADSAESSADDLRARAVVLAAQPRRTQQREAVAILERLDERRRLSTEDLFLLAQIYERIEENTKSRATMSRVLGVAGSNPRYLAFQINSLMRQGLVNDALLWSEKLKEVLPGELITLELRARILTALNQKAEAVQPIKQHGLSGNAATALYVANLCEELGQPEAAEELFRRYAALGQQPDATLVLARHLARRGRLEDALRLCESVQNAGPIETIAFGQLAVLRAGRANLETCRRTERWLEQALTKQPQSVNLLNCQADLLDLEGRYSESEIIYRKTLQRDPNNLVALNNLAWQLALRPGRGNDALTLANHALEVGGPLPALLDTRSLAHLAVRDFDAALNDLQDAAGPQLDRETRASVLFHLAQVYRALDRRDDAKETMVKALAINLTEADVHPLERSIFRDMQPTQ